MFLLKTKIFKFYKLNNFYSELFERRLNDYSYKKYNKENLL